MHIHGGLSPPEISSLPQGMLQNVQAPDPLKANGLCYGRRGLNTGNRLLPEVHETIDGLSLLPLFC